MAATIESVWVAMVSQQYLKGSLDFTKNVQESTGMAKRIKTCII